MKALRLKTHHFDTKLPYQKPMSGQIEWRVQNGLITKYEILPVATLFFQKFCFSLRTLYKELIWITKDTDAHIRTFYKQGSFIWRCFFPASILKVAAKLYFIYFSLGVIILFSMGLCKSVFFINSLEKLGYRVSVFFVLCVCTMFWIRCDLKRLKSIWLIILIIQDFFFNHGCLVYVFFGFFRKSILVNLRRQFRVRKIFRTQVFARFQVFSCCI